MVSKSFKWERRWFGGGVGGGGGVGAVFGHWDSPVIPACQIYLVRGVGGVIILWHWDNSVLPAWQVHLVKGWG